MKLILALLFPCSALAGGSASVYIKDLYAVQDAKLEQLNIEGKCETQIADNIVGMAQYTFNKDRFKPSNIRLTSSADSSLGKVQGTLSVNPQAKTAILDGTLLCPNYGTISTSITSSEQGKGGLGPFRWTSNRLFLRTVPGDDTSVVVSGSHDINTKQGFVKLAVKLNNNFDAKISLPSDGEPEVNLVGAHSPNMKSDVSFIVKTLKLAKGGFGKGALGMAYRRDLETGQGSSSRVSLEALDTGNYAWVLSNTTKRMTLVLTGKGKFTPGSKTGALFAPSTVSLRQSFRFF